MNWKPWDYQEHAKTWILEHKACGLFLEMGLGKTVITLSAVKELLQAGKITKALVIAPLRVAATVWAEEAAKWDHLVTLRCVKVLGSEKQRLAALNEEADVYIMNRENTAWLVNHQAAEGKWPFDMLVLDELSSFKSPKAERFKCLRRVRPACRRVVGLTGTPAPNGLLDLWSQVYLLDRGERLEKTLGGYRSRYFDEGRRNGNIVYNWIPKKGAAEAIYKKICDICMSMTAEDYLQMPDRRDIIYPVVLDSEGLTAYESMEREYLLPLKDEVITAANAAVLTGKLLQLANGAIYSSDDRKSYGEVHQAKLEAMQDLIEAANGQPVLVYYAFRHDLHRLKRTFPQARELITPQDVNDWNAGQIPVLLVHPDSAGHGLNLQAGGHIIIWFGLTWSLEKYQQANARLYRQGQSQPVTVYHVITAGTVDENVLHVLQQKEARQDALIDAVKARIERYAS